MEVCSSIGSLHNQRPDIELRPWLAPFHPLLQGILDDASGTSFIPCDWPRRCNVLAAGRKLVNHRGLTLQFVPQSALPFDSAYEAFISKTGSVPTRENLHDFFNALVWLTYPKSKSALNAIQALEIEREFALRAADVSTGHRSTRGLVRDRATIFDENAAVMLTCDLSFAESLAAHRWNEFLVERRADFGVLWELALFGHALIEKLVNPYKAITAHVWVLQVEPAFFNLAAEAKRLTIDALLCERLERAMLTLPAAHLPVLGVPGWWKDQDETFYQDVKVFRPKRL